MSPAHPGETLDVEGERHVGLTVMLEGEADVIFVDPVSDGQGAGGAEAVISTNGPGRFLNELNLLTGQRVVLRGRMRTSARVLHLDRTSRTGESTLQPLGSAGSV